MREHTLKMVKIILDLMAHACNPTTQVTKIGRLQIVIKGL
jgi:hypothetical protein